MSARARVCVLHVGGTIGMVRTATGFEPQPGFLQRYIAAMPEMDRPELPAHDVVSLEPLLDSADMAPEDWLRIAAAIVARYEDYAGFVVVHGTDTMAYTASALSFLLPDLRKPVILTGSQLSLENVRSDGREHIITAILLAGTLAVPEVCIYFASRLLRGNRAQKIHNHDFVAFDSGNLPPLASVGVSVDLAEHLVRAPGHGPLVAPTLRCRPHVASLRLFPGITARLLEQVLAPPMQGLVLETYGVGNAPSRDPALLAAVAAATEREVVVVNCSQCHGGSVRQTLYSTGAALARCGVISGGDMTPEAALTKLYCLLAAGLSPGQVRVRMQEDLAGELIPG
ncbi:type I asparaginase [Nannocystis sp.]|uniref:type I asparaginase n=1 Tax=Nannocystis sp. TaxID=1962667 RepID=UPI0024220F31|nr:type I asparaginase [Nannocystis sp.]MBK7824633.1 type I asparaginase [Nannocystis sp.]MBK9753116.1 type I asparaginase [Nannocystis sp.]